MNNNDLISLWNVLFAIMEHFPEFIPLSKISSRKYDWVDHEKIFNNFVESEFEKVEFEKNVSSAAILLKNLIKKCDLALDVFCDKEIYFFNINKEIQVKELACDMLDEIIKHADEHNNFLIKSLENSIIKSQLIINRYQFVVDKYANVASSLFFKDKSSLIQCLDSNGIDHSIERAVISSLPDEMHTIVTRREIANYIGQSVSTVKKEMKKGLPHKIQLNRRVTANPKELDIWLESKKK